MTQSAMLHPHNPPDPCAARGYLDTPSMGLPTDESVEAIQQALVDWASGRADYHLWERSSEACRDGFAKLFGTRTSRVGLVPSVVPAVAAAAGGLVRGGVVIAHAMEFRSLLLPVLATVGEQRMRWVNGPYVAQTFLPAIDRDTEAVLVSSASSHDGGRPRLSVLLEACRSVGANLFVDGTQTAGIAELDVRVDDLSLFACAGYKGLRGPRGTGYAVMRDDLAGHATARSPYGVSDAAERGTYGPPLRSKTGAAGLDQSPAWFSWVGAAPALASLLHPDGAHAAPPTALAGHLRDRLDQLGFAPQQTDLPSPIVTFAVADPPATLDQLHQAGVTATVKFDRIRLGFHTYNDDSDVDLVSDVLHRFRRGPRPHQAKEVHR